MSALRSEIEELQAAWGPGQIASLRGRLRMNQDEMAARLGYSHRNRVSELENGTRDVTPSVALLLEYLDRHGPLTDL